MIDQTKFQNNLDQSNINMEQEEQKKRRNTIEDAIRATNIEQNTNNVQLEGQMNNYSNINNDSRCLINQNQGYMYTQQNIPMVINKQYNYSIPNQYTYGYNINQRNQLNTNIGYQNYNTFNMYGTPAMPTYNQQLNYMPYQIIGNQNYNIMPMNTTYGAQPMMQQQNIQYQTQLSSMPIMQTQMQMNQPQQPPPPTSLQLQHLQRTEENHQEYRKTRWNSPIVVPDSLYQQFKLPVPETNQSQQNNKFSNNLGNAGRGGGKSDKKEWPPELVQYTTKCFEKCSNNKERKFMEKALKNIINIAINCQELQSRDWKNYPQPLLPREKNTMNNQQQQQNNNNNSSSELMTVSQLMQNKNKENSNNQQTQDQDSHNKQVQDVEKEKIDILSRIRNQQDINVTLKRPASHLLDMNKELGSYNKKNIKFNPKPARELNITKRNDILSNDIDESEYLDFEKLANKWKITGTCQDLEKPYLRLTKQPDPSQIRPEHILKKSLNLILQKWKNNECQYEYIQEQFRSIRQDLIIQHIKNDFTVQVCEHNARICLETRDVMQFSQCCATLFDMYKEGIEGNQAEFNCYNLIHHFLKNDLCQLITLTSQLSIQNTNDSMIVYAFEIVKAVQQGNVSKFFKLYRKGPLMTPCVIDMFLDKMRIWGLMIICKSFGQQMEIEKLTTLMNFNDVIQTKDYIKSLGAKLDSEEKNILLRDSHKPIAENQNTVY